MLAILPLPFELVYMLLVKLDRFANSAYHVFSVDQPVPVVALDRDGPLVLDVSVEGHGLAGLRPMLLIRVLDYWGKQVSQMTVLAFIDVGVTALEAGITRKAFNIHDG